MDKIKQDFSPKTMPLEHQVEAIQYVLERKESALFDEQGLGKTKIVIDALSQSMKKNEIDAVLVITPLSLVFIWEQEIEKHTHLLPIVLRGNDKEKRYKLLTGANFYITNYEAISTQLERMKRFCKSKRFAIVLDEATRIKEPTTKTACALFELSPLTVKRIILTGTPVANSPTDIWALFYFLDQGRLLGESFEQFRSQYNEKSPNYLMNLEKLRNTIESYSLRRLKQNVLELPEKVIININVELTGKQLEIYQILKEELRIEIMNLDGEIIIDESENILKKLLRLVQIASNPKLVDFSFVETPNKFNVLDKLVDDIVMRGEKVVVWSCFVENILLLKARYKDLCPLIIYGATPVSERATIVKSFQEIHKHLMMIANPTAAREGLTLTSANNAIYLDRNFSLIDYLQSQDRIHRISQKKKCSIYKIIATGTIDEYVDRIIDLKSEIAKLVQKDIEKIGEKSMDTLINKKTLLELLGG